VNHKLAETKIIWSTASTIYLFYSRFRNKYKTHGNTQDQFFIEIHWHSKKKYLWRAIICFQIYEQWQTCWYLHKIYPTNAYLILFSFYSLTQESSTQKLLFYKDVAEYRKSVKTLFLKVEMVSDQEFWGAMDDMSTVSRRSLIVLLGIILCYRMVIILWIFQ